MNTIETLNKIITTLQTQLPGCVPVSVGGSVRDAIMADTGNLEESLSCGKDYDLEIFKAQPLIVEKVLLEAGINIELVGQAFPVYKVKGHDIDISFPRKETCVGEGHTDYTFELNPNMTFEEAALRRDFTMNAIGYDWNTKRVLDPYGGVRDISNKLLRPVSHKFQEDALRVLRTFKFIARYGFAPSAATLVFCQMMIPKLRNFAKERIQKEWFDFILKGQPAYVAPALQFLIDCNADELYPELFLMREVPQQPEFHPEGNCLEHTIYCFEEFCSIRQYLPSEDRLVVGLAVLCHDMGKISATQIDDAGNITAHGHETTPHARMFLERLFHPADQTIVEVEQLVQAHMRPYSLFKDKVGLSAIRRLNVAVEGRLDRLMQVVWCDQMGRPGIFVDQEALIWLADQIKLLQVKPDEKIKPIIMGRHIIEHLHLAPGPRIGEILDALFEAQIEGKFNDVASGVAYLKANFPV